MGASVSTGPAGHRRYRRIERDTLSRMERFTQSIKDEYPELNGPAEIEITLETLHGLKMPDCDGIGLSPVSKMPAKILVLLQVGLRRTIEFTEAAVREINQRNLATSALLSRGTIETSCLLW